MIFFFSYHRFMEALYCVATEYLLKQVIFRLPQATQYRLHSSSCSQHCMKPSNPHVASIGGIWWNPVSFLEENCAQLWANKMDWDDDDDSVVERNEVLELTWMDLLMFVCPSDCQNFNLFFFITFELINIQFILYISQSRWIIKNLNKWNTKHVHF